MKRQDVVLRTSPCLEIFISQEYDPCANSSAQMCGDCGHALPHLPTKHNQSHNLTLSLAVVRQAGRQRRHELEQVSIVRLCRQIRCLLNMIKRRLLCQRTLRCWPTRRRRLFAEVTSSPLRWAYPPQNQRQQAQTGH